MGIWHLELLQTDFEGSLNIVMYHVVVLHYYTICEGGSFLLNRAIRLSTVLTIGSGWQHCDFQIMIRETNDIIGEYTFNP